MKKRGYKKGRAGAWLPGVPADWGLRLLWLGAAGAVMVLGLWHFLDVRAGVAETGNSWLYGWYGLLMVVGTAALALLGAVLLGERSWSLERVYPAAVLVLGLMYMAVLPPLSAPDEVSHFISAYELSNKVLGWEQRNEEGLIYIRAQDAFIEDLGDVMADDGSGWRDSAAREPVILGQLLTQDTYRFIHEKGLGGSGEEGRAVSYQPSVRTTPLAYVPQTAGITLARLLGLGGIGLLFLGRLCNLVLYAVMGYAAIRRMPFGKEVFCGVSLLPMSLHLAASLSYDVMILALSGYFAAVCLDLAYEAERVRPADILALALVMAVMGPCKMVYGAIAGFCLLIPVRKFGGWGKWAVSAAVVLGSFGVAMAVVNLGTVAMYAQADSGYIAWAGEEGYTFAELMHRPLHVIRMCYNTLMWEGEPLYSGMIGEALGNKDSVLNTPYVAVLGLTAALVILSLKKPGESMRMSLGNRVWIWLVCLGILGALMFSMLLAWTPKGYNVIKGVQGRYLLPMLPMFLLTLKNDRIVRTDWNDREILFAMAATDIYVIWRIFSVVCLRV